MLIESNRRHKDKTPQESTDPAYWQRAAVLTGAGVWNGTANASREPSRSAGLSGSFGVRLLWLWGSFRAQCPGGEGQLVNFQPRQRFARRALPLSPPLGAGTIADSCDCRRVGPARIEMMLFSATPGSHPPRLTRCLSLSSSPPSPPPFLRYPFQNCPLTVSYLLELKHPPCPDAFFCIDIETPSSLLRRFWTTTRRNHSNKCCAKSYICAINRGATRDCADSSINWRVITFVVGCAAFSVLNAKRGLAPFRVRMRSGDRYIVHIYIYVYTHTNIYIYIYICVEADDWAPLVSRMTSSLAGKSSPLLGRIFSARHSYY